MKKIHKYISVLIWLLVFVGACLSNAQLTDVTAQTLVTFFAVVFGFYITSIAILYSASYTKNLHKFIDEKDQKRGTHILKSYLLTSGYCSIFSITSIIVFTAFATKNSTGVLSTKIACFISPFIILPIDLNLLLSSALYGFAGLNVFFMILLLHTIIDGMIEEAKQ